MGTWIASSNERYLIVYAPPPALAMSVLELQADAAAVLVPTLQTRWDECGLYSPVGLVTAYPSFGKTAEGARSDDILKPWDVVVRLHVLPISIGEEEVSFLFSNR